eukprot:826523-Rhodomonas_salina.1
MLGQQGAGVGLREWESGAGASRCGTSRTRGRSRQSQRPTATLSHRCAPKSQHAGNGRGSAMRCLFDSAASRRPASTQRRVVGAVGSVSEIVFTFRRGRWPTAARKCALTHGEISCGRAQYSNTWC